MFRYLLIFFETSETLCEGFSSWRKYILSEWTELSPLFYLNADDPITPINKYRHVNVYEVEGNTTLDLRRIDEHLRLHSNQCHLLGYHWQLHDGISRLRQSSHSTATVVTVGMTIPDENEVIQELNQWYELEHMPGLANVPGWLAGMRMKLAHASDQHDTAAAPYLAIHEWRDSNGLGGPIWKRAVMTPWTERISGLHTAPPYRRVWAVCN